MYYLINDIFLLVIVILLIISLKQGKYGYAITITVASYFCAPVIKIKNVGINPAYLFTFVLSIWVFILLLNKRVKISKYVKWFIIGSSVSIVLVGIAWLTHAQCRFSHIVHFMGMVQYMLAIIALCILYSKVENDRFIDSFYEGIKVAVVWNFLLTILQMFLPKVGIFITQLFYAYQGRDAAIIYTKNIGRFLRAFGAAYSSTVTGGFCLFTLAFLLFILLKKESWKKELKFFFMTLFVGLFAFSKAVILGIFILFILLIGFMYLLKIRKNYKRIVTCFCVTILTFCIIALLGNMLGLSGQVNYYFGKIFSPLSALETRYGNIEKNGDHKAENRETKSEKGETELEGNLEEAIEVIKDNFFTGVGPAPIRGEFVGDSQYVVTLHDGGIINLLVYIVLYLSIFIVAWRNKNISRCLLITVMALEGISVLVFLYAYAIPFVAFCLMITKREEEQDEKVLSVKYY